MITVKPASTTSLANLATERRDAGDLVDDDDARARCRGGRSGGSCRRRRTTRRSHPASTSVGDRHCSLLIASSADSASISVPTLNPSSTCSIDRRDRPSPRAGSGRRRPRRSPPAATRRTRRSSRSRTGRGPCASRSARAVRRRWRSPRCPVGSLARPFGRAGVGPVDAEVPDVGERVAERAQLPVEHRRDPAGRRVGQAVAEPVVAVGDRDAVLLRASAAPAGRRPRRSPAARGSWSSPTASSSASPDARRSPSRLARSPRPTSSTSTSCRSASTSMRCRLAARRCSTDISARPCLRCRAPRRRRSPSRRTAHRSPTRRCTARAPAARARRSCRRRR